METFLDAEFLRRINGLSLLAHGRFRGSPAGTRRTPRAGMSLEFAEYKEYHPGDDIRYVDWNLYGRLGRLFIKVFTREEDFPIYLFLDVSRSMAIGGKLTMASRLAGALAYLGLKDQNRVGVFPFAGDLVEGVAPRGGYRQIYEIFRFLQAVEPTGETSIDHSLERFTRVRRESGLAILISDMLSEQGYREGLARLLYHGFEPLVLQLLSPHDFGPSERGEYHLRDIEGEEELPLSLDAKALADYRARFDRYQAELKQFCRERSIGYALIASDRPIEEIIFETLRRRAVLQ